MTARNALCAALVALVLCACGAAQSSLPVSIRRCDAVMLARGVTVNATIHNDATKPASAVRVAVEFYQNFRFERFIGDTKLAHGLDPGKSQDVVLTMEKSGNVAVSGKAMRCYATHVDYLDGTSDDLRSQQGE